MTDRPLRPFIVCLLCAVGAAASVASAFGQQITDEWKYTLRRPPQGWRGAGFDDGAWKSGNGGFGTAETPGIRLGTNWSTNNIWLRKQFRLDEIPQNPALLMHHDEDAEVFINGRQVAAVKGYVTEYIVVPIAAGQRQALKSGENIMAVHCRQTGGGQFIDVHLVDADNVPELPPEKRDLTPFQSDLITTWGAEVTAENAWTEYPRPQMVRDAWTNLNGMWQYAVTGADVTSAPAEWTGEILVPFCPESKLSGVRRMLGADEALWYRRTFTAPQRSDRRVLLNFEAVDYLSHVFVNGTAVGSHQGGNTPFQFDITDALRDGDNELIVRVEDDTEEWQLRGKQVLNPRGIWYTQVSGIWQTVWLEEVSTAHITDLTVKAGFADGKITVRADVHGAAEGATLRLTVSDAGQSVAAAAAPVSAGVVEVTIPEALRKPWSPDTPHLYDMVVSVSDAAGVEQDSVESYAGLRDVGRTEDAAGNVIFTLNGEPVFHWGPLDQGWWPDGLLTPPSDEALLFDVEYLKKAGFNMIRKHIKVEPRRFYYHCDRIGMMVWQDQVSAGHNPPWTRLQPNPQDADWPDEHHEQFMLELERMVDSLENHPSIVVWVPFNEAWGQHRTVETGRWMVERDPTRLVNIASGGNFWPAGHIVDEHRYPHPGFPFELGADGRFDGFIKVMGEFGGHGLPIEGHLWDADRRNWGYGDLPKNAEEYRERYVESIRLLRELKARGIAGGVYTQTTDVEGEVNGLMTYDRKVMKLSAEDLAEIHRTLFTE